MAAWYHISSPPPTGQGAIAIIELRGEVGAVLERLGAGEVAAGRVVLRRLPGVDEMVVARLAPDAAVLFPHAGPAVVRRVVNALERAGAARADSDRLEDDWPEAADAVEARLCAALARAASPQAIDLLLDQPRRWREVTTLGKLSERDSAVLRRLIDPPLVVALGPPNIGKSTLLNALAGRQVAVVADQPGSTRDHVGLLIDLAGLVVRFVDAPGIESATPDPLAAEAQRLALQVAEVADLVLLCGDAGTQFLPAPPGRDALRVALRGDLGLPAEPFDVSVAVHPSSGSPRGLEALVSTVRDRLVPPDLLADQRAWRFWG